MYELIQAGENTFYIDCPTKLGVFRTPQGAYLIDSGTARTLENGPGRCWTPTAGPC